MATRAALRHGAEIDRRWAGRLRGRAVVVIRKVAGKNVWSQHSYGNATDRSGPRADMAALAVWSAQTAGVWSVATVIYNRRIWSSKTRRWSTYTGVNPHTTHVHIDYLPRWVGTPPGRTLGSAPSQVRIYPAIPPGPSGLDLAVTRATTWRTLLRTNLRRGSRGNIVVALQFLLRRHGFMATGSIDGIFGPVTESAVTRAQGMAQVAVTGRVTDRDWRALYWGPAAWRTTDITVVAQPGWLAPPSTRPSGELEHSWESTLRALTPLVGRTADTTGWYARTIRDVVS